MNYILRNSSCTSRKVCASVVGSVGCAQTLVLSCSSSYLLSESTVAPKTQFQAKCWNVNHHSYNFWENFLFPLFMQPLEFHFGLGPAFAFKSLCHLCSPPRQKVLQVAASLGSLVQLCWGEGGLQQMALGRMGSARLDWATQGGHHILR